MKNNSESEKTGMIITRIYSVINWVGAIASLILGILLIVFSSKIASALSAIGVTYGSGLFILFGIVIFLIGMLGVAVAWGMWNFKNWARILTLIFAGLSILTTILGLFTAFNAWNLLWLIFYVVIFYLFGFYKPVVHLFYDAFLARKKNGRL